MSGWDDLGGQRQLSSAYDGTRHKWCPECGAEPDQPCTFETTELGKQTTVRKTRHHPCLARVRAS